MEEDWNDEGAPAIDHACILNAKRFVYLLSDAMPGQTSTESAPSVYPTIDGGVQLYWNLRERQVSLTFRPGQDNVEFAEKVQGQPLSRSFVSVEPAARIALQAINDAL